MPDPTFYGADQAVIHDREFGDLARRAADYLRSLLDEAGLRHGTVVDLGCGSGILAGVLTDAGYDVLGVDISQHMLDLASANAPKASFRRGSLLDVDLPPAVAVTAIGEALNYAADQRAGVAELERLAARVREALASGGVFLFDVAGPGRHGRDGIAHRYHDHDDWTLYMQAEESGDHTTLDRRITIFRKSDEPGSGGFRRSDEHHVLRLYEPGAVLDALARAGFEATFSDAYGASSRSTPDAGWTVVVARPAPFP
jgi:predicted TPR repeat methyltransferase